MTMLGYPRFLAYAIGRFDAHHVDRTFRADHNEPSPLGGFGEYLRANARDLNSVLARLSDDDRFGHSAYFFKGHPPQRDEYACPYCREHTWIEVRELSDEGEQIRFPMPESVLRSNAAIIFSCEKCGWWRLINHFKDGICNDWDHTLWFTNFIYDGVLHDFPVGHHRAIQDLRTQLRRRAIDLRNISPTNLERVVGAVLQDHLGVNVRHVGGPGDGGIDLIVTEADDPIAVQVKRRSRAGSVESVAEVRHLLGSMMLAGYRRGVFATTADRFSQDARRAAEQGRRLSVIIELYDHQKLLELIQRTPPLTNPWEQLLRPAASALWTSDGSDESDDDESVFVRGDRRIAQHPTIAAWLERVLRRFR